MSHVLETDKFDCMFCMELVWYRVFERLLQCDVLYCDGYCLCVCV